MLSRLVEQEGAAAGLDQALHVGGGGGSRLS